MPLSLSSAVLVAVISSLFRPDPFVQEAEVTKEIVAYTSVRDKLAKETQVPLHLPTFIPFSGDSRNPVFAILDSTDSRSYEIQLAWSGDCTGGNWCHLGSIQGSTNPISAEGRRIPVSLRGGVRGYFVKSRCYAFCTEAMILWSQDGAHYAVGIKAGDEKVLLKMANSAIK
jgi:hypothetical protein